MKSTKLLLVFAFLFSFYSDSEIKQSDFRVESTSIQTNKNNTENCTQQITGTVLDRETKKPLVNALVTLFINNEESKLVKVNSKGEYTITINCNTDYKIIATSNNFFSETYKFKTTSKDNDKISYNFLLDKECYQMITGTVLNQLSKEAIDKVKTTLYLNGEETDSFIVNSTGKYEFKVRCNTNYYIMANKLNFINDIYEFSSSKINNEIIKHDFILEPECIQTISGTVFNKVTKEPLSCELKLYLNNVEVETINVNNDGSYFVKFQCTTNYKIIASKPNYHNDSYNFLTDYIENKQPDYFHLKKDLFLEPDECFQIVMGKVLDKNTHKEIPNTTVSLIFQNQEIKTFETNSDASYFFTVKCGLLYELKATKEGKQSAIINYTASLAKDDKKTQNIYLENEICNQIVNGTVIDKVTKLPLANTKVSLLENNNEVNSTYTNTNGTFNFTINCESSYKIVAANSEYNSNSIVFETNKTRNETTSKSIELTLLDCNQIVNGTVIDKVTKLPLANTKVSLLENNNEVNSTYTNTNGTFNFTINCDSSYKIVAANNLYFDETVNIVSNNNRNTEQSITLSLIKKECKQTVTGIIRDKISKKPLPNSTISLYQNDKVIDTYTVGNDGVYQFDLECSSTYKLTVFKNNNLESFRLKTAAENGRTLTLHIEIEPLVCIQYINGVVSENISKNPIPNATITLLNITKDIEKTTTDSNGTFYFEIECDKSYTLKVEKENYTNASLNLNSTGKSAYAHTIEFVIEPIIQISEKNGIRFIETKPIDFELDEYEITDENKIELNKIVFNMNQNPSIKIEINYHTDSRGPDAYNLQLTINRANATKDYLISKGISADRIKANGFGETQLLNKCKNDVKCTDAEHLENRRTEFIVKTN
jgi:outer membrane protein OmpA-like peptidoglycan-associated protein